MSKMSAMQHRLDSRPMMSSEPQMNSTEDTKYAMRKGDSGRRDGFVHLPHVSGNEELASSRDGEERPERNARKENRKFFPRAVSQHHEADQRIGFHCLLPCKMSST